MIECFAVIDRPVHLPGLRRPVCWEAGSLTSACGDHPHFLLSNQRRASENGPYCLLPGRLRRYVEHMVKQQPVGLPSDTDDWQRSETDLSGIVSRMKAGLADVPGQWLEDQHGRRVK